MWQGPLALLLWPDAPANPIGTCVPVLGARLHAPPRDVRMKIGWPASRLQRGRVPERQCCEAIGGEQAAAQRQVLQQRPQALLLPHRGWPLRGVGCAGERHHDGPVVLQICPHARRVHHQWQPVLPQKLPRAHL